VQVQQLKVHSTYLLVNQKANCMNKTVIVRINIYFFLSFPLDVLQITNVTYMSELQLFGTIEILDVFR
jgi:hypothetical protein